MKLGFEKLPRPAILVIGGGIGLALILGAFLVIGDGDSPGPQADQPPDQTAPVPAQPPEAPATATDPSAAPDNRLPENWDQLSEAEKIALNPFDCQPSPSGEIEIDNQTGHCRTSGNPGETNSGDQKPEQPEPGPALGFGQSFQVQIYGSLRLEMTATGFDCQPVDQQALRYVRGKTQAEIQTAFDDYNSGQPSSPGERISVLATYSSAFSYLDNFKRHLGPEAPPTTAGLWQELTRHKECQAGFRATNIGDLWTFSDGCGLDFDDYLAAVDSQGRTHQPLYLGEGWACTQALVPFPTGETIETGVYFTLPIDRQISSLVVDDGQSRLVISVDSPN